MTTEKQKKLFRIKHLLRPKAVRYIAFVLLVAIFASTCLLPISETRAQSKAQALSGLVRGAKPIGTLENVGATLFKGVGGAAKSTSKVGGASRVGEGAAVAAGGALGSLGSTALTAGLIFGLVTGLLIVAKNFVAYMLSPSPELYNLNTPFIQVGWRMIRDICNLFFLLVLLFIAFCTILQIEKYNAKKNLLTLVLMALLINFSKPIAVFIFDGSQLLMTWFLQSSGDGQKITDMLSAFGQIGSLVSVPFAQTSFWDAAMSGLFNLIFLFVFDVVMFCLGLFLLIRVVAIWLIVIVSPVAFFAMILPDFRKLSTQWWDALFRYSYVGPAIAFFLWLATRMRSFQVSPQSYSIVQPTSSMQSLPVFIPFMITIVFLFAALMMANQFGIQFSQAITKNAERFMGWAASNALKWGERTALGTRKVKIGGKEFSVTLSPRAWIKGWQEHSAEIDRRFLDQAMAHPRDVLSNTFKRGERPKTYFRDLQFGKLKEEKKKELQMISEQSEYLLDQIDRAKKKKTPEAQATAAAAMDLMFGQNDQDDYSIDGKRLPLNPFKAKRDLLKDLMDTGMTEQVALRHMNQLGYIALPKGNVGFWKMTRFNTAAQKWELTPDADQLLGINAKSRTVETQGYAKVAHRDSFMIEDANPDRDIDPNAPVRVFVGVHAVGMDQSSMVAENKALLTQFLARNKPDTLDAIAGHAADDLYNSARIWKESSEQLAERMRESAGKWDARAEREAQRGNTAEAGSARGRAVEYRVMAEEALTPESRAMRAKYAAGMREFYDEAVRARDVKKEKGGAPASAAATTGGDGGKGGGAQGDATLKALLEEIRGLRADITGRPAPTVVVEESAPAAAAEEEDDDPDKVND